MRSRGVANSVENSAETTTSSSFSSRSSRSVCNTDSFDLTDSNNNSDCEEHEDNSVGKLRGTKYYYYVMIYTRLIP